MYVVRLLDAIISHCAVQFMCGINGAARCWWARPRAPSSYGGTCSSWKARSRSLLSLLVSVFFAVCFIACANNTARVQPWVCRCSCISIRDTTSLTCTSTLWCPSTQAIRPYGRRYSPLFSPPVNSSSPPVNCICVRADCYVV